MTIYRVGDQGATVYARDGRPLVRLAPGMTVQPGVSDHSVTGTSPLAGREHRSPTDVPSGTTSAAVPILPPPLSYARKRIRGYADKVIRAGHDYDDKGSREV